jgi:transcriptional repressor NrdR
VRGAVDVHCPYCRHTDTRVLDSRVAEDGGAIRRRRSCNQCGKRFSTVEQMQLVVVKRSGATEPFTRDKAIAGVRKACKGRPVSEDDLACLGQQVEDALRGEGWAEVPAHEVGLAILTPLRELDEVAYLRFASVYRAFESADDFEAEIALLRAERGAGSPVVEALDASAASLETLRAERPLVEEGEARARLETKADPTAVQPAPTG